MATFAFAFATANPPCFKHLDVANASLGLRKRRDPPHIFDCGGRIFRHGYPASGRRWKSLKRCYQDAEKSHSFSGIHQPVDRLDGTLITAGSPLSYL